MMHLLWKYPTFWRANFQGYGNSNGMKTMLVLNIDAQRMLARPCTNPNFWQAYFQAYWNSNGLETKLVVKIKAKQMLALSYTNPSFRQA